MDQSLEGGPNRNSIASACHSFASRCDFYIFIRHHTNANCFLRLPFLYGQICASFKVSESRHRFGNFALPN